MVRRHRSHGKRVILWMVGFVILGQLAGGWFIDNVCPIIRFPYAYQRFASLEKLLAAGQSPDLVYFGSSRFGVGLHEGVMTKAMRTLVGDPKLLAFSGTVPGGDLITADFMLEEILRRGAKPSLALIEICPEVVNHRNDWLKMHVLRQLTWGDIPQYGTEICATGHLGRLLQARLLPLYAHRYHFWKQVTRWLDWPILGPLNEYPYLAWEERWDPPIKVPAKVNPRALELSLDGIHGVQRCLKQYQVAGNSLLALERLKERCRRNGIEMLFVCPPLATPHRRQYTPEIENQFADLLRRLEQTPGCHVVDCRQNLPDSLFDDHHHIAWPGMFYFNKQLCQDVLAPYWQTHFVHAEQGTQ